MKTRITSNDGSNPAAGAPVGDRFGRAPNAVAIMHGKRYRCDTATHIAEYHCGLRKTDLHYLVEALFQTPKGEFFLCGKGGPMTRHWNLHTNTRDGQHVIQALLPKAAQAWLESHGFVAILENLFADNLEDA